MFPHTARSKPIPWCRCDSSEGKIRSVPQKIFFADHQANAACGNFSVISQLSTAMDLLQNHGQRGRIDPCWLVEQYASVMAQLHDGQGDREALLGERSRLIEQGERIGLRSFWVDYRPEGA